MSGFQEGIFPPEILSFQRSSMRNETSKDFGGPLFTY